MCVISPKNLQPTVWGAEKADRKRMVCGFTHLISDGKILPLFFCCVYGTKIQTFPLNPKKNAKCFNSLRANLAEYFHQHIFGPLFSSSLLIDLSNISIQLPQLISHAVQRIRKFQFLEKVSSLHFRTLSTQHKFLLWFVLRFCMLFRGS